MQIIERALPKKPKVKKDPSVIEKEEMEKIGKVWVSIVKRDIPRYHKTFFSFHKKQQIDARRFSENCQREVCIIKRSIYSSTFVIKYLTYRWLYSTFLVVCSVAIVTIGFLIGETESE